MFTGMAVDLSAAIDLFAKTSLLIHQRSKTELARDSVVS